MSAQHDASNTTAEPRGLRFWRWVRARAEAKIREHHMRTFKHDRRCANCGQWGAIVGMDWANIREIDPMHEGLTCLGCGHETKWFVHSMVPIIAEDVRHVG
ncbi:hypothetical protein [Limobrevibacterium gyesilva]|uniref:Uncharacterized protein n=1 Tax=Limobrevibacterium gyesilva TaxID=2991712 RepID=A0AA42CFQ6_9PROT|nr:hypothetical protein [Limobrevibacterium gyesilva]MCW3477393.1 hypothetical protein [Limobrevibacterium gyesilva]